MNGAHIHLLLNHLPVAGSLIGALLLAAAALRRSAELRAAALAILVFSAIAAIPAHLTGESAEDRVEHLPGVSQAIIERHEDAALASTIALELLGVAALAALWVGRRSARLPRTLAVSLAVLCLLTVGLLARTANLGGQIRHSEIRPLQ
jgi:uncharacterized membrane protein